MDRSKLLERWKEYQDRYPNVATELKRTLCTLYEARRDQEKFNSKLDHLRGLLSEREQQILGVNAVDKQSLIAWASAMGLIFLVKKEHTNTGRHA